MIFIILGLVLVVLSGMIWILLSTRNFQKLRIRELEKEVTDLRIDCETWRSQNDLLLDRNHSLMRSLIIDNEKSEESKPSPTVIETNKETRLIDWLTQNK